jgi:PE-PPE domain
VAICQPRSAAANRGSPLGKHRKPARNWGPYVTAGLALEAAALVGMSYTGDGHIPGANLLATSIFVDGTKSITGNELGNPPYRMADSLQGRYDNGDGNQFVMYPRSLGPATGLGDPTYDESEGLATAQVVELVKAAKDDAGYKKQCEEGPCPTIYVVGYSQGAGGAARAIPELEKEGLTDNVEFVLAANPRRNDGGILTRFPPGVYVPLFGVTFGEGTTPESTKVLQVTKQYDGVGDAPKYFLNVAADANAALGFYYLHGDYYKDVDPTADFNRTDAIVSSTPDGNVTDVLVLSPHGQLPLTRPLLQLGVPQNIVSALDPFLRSVIETGYDRPSGQGTYPSEPVRFSVVPPPTRWLSDVQSVAAGAMLTTERLTTVGPQLPTAGIENRSAAPALTAARADEDQPVEPTKDNGDQVTDTDSVKAEPPKRNVGGWKPGDLLRSILTPKSKDDTKPADTAPAPAPGPAGKADPGDSGSSTDSNANASDSGASQ